jgi:hypothetical protein
MPETTGQLVHRDLERRNQREQGNNIYHISFDFSRHCKTIFVVIIFVIIRQCGADIFVSKKNNVWKT